MNDELMQRAVMALERIAAALERLTEARIEHRVNPPPEHDASLDVWLAWRDTERAHGQKCSLERVSELSRHGLSAVKKRSAERNKARGDQ